MRRICLWDLTITVDEKNMFMRSYSNCRWEEYVCEIFRTVMRRIWWDLTITVEMFMRSHHNSRWEEYVYEMLL